MSMTFSHVVHHFYDQNQLEPFRMNSNWGDWYGGEHEDKPRRKRKRDRAIIL